MDLTNNFDKTAPESQSLGSYVIEVRRGSHGGLSLAINEAITQQEPNAVLSSITLINGANALLHFTTGNIEQNMLARLEAVEAQLSAVLQLLKERV